MNEHDLTLLETVNHICNKHHDLRTATINMLANNIHPWQHPGSTFIHSKIVPGATLSPWLADTKFMNVYNRVKANTLVDIFRCYELWALVRQSVRVDGDILEVGVWRGGTGALLAKAIQDRSDKKVFLADTFTGVVKAGENDTLYLGGEHSDTSVEVVNDLLRSLDVVNTEILKGIFPDETEAAVPGKIAFLHCDVDVYTSTRDIVSWALPRLSIGSIMVFDDYGFYGCDGETKFCDEFRQDRNFIFIHNLNGHAVFIKLA